MFSLISVTARHAVVSGFCHGLQFIGGTRRSPARSRRRLMRTTIGFAVTPRA